MPGHLSPCRDGSLPTSSWLCYLWRSKVLRRLKFLLRQGLDKNKRRYIRLAVSVGRVLRQSDFFGLFSFFLPLSLPLSAIAYVSVSRRMNGIIHKCECAKSNVWWLNFEAERRKRKIMQKHTGERENEKCSSICIWYQRTNERALKSIWQASLPLSFFLHVVLSPSLSHFGSSADYTETVCSLFTQRIYFFLHLSLSPVRVYLSKKIKFSGGYLPESKKKS